MSVPVTPELRAWAARYGWNEEQLAFYAEHGDWSEANDLYENRARMAALARTGPAWEPYAPTWAPHVAGRYTPRVVVDGEPEDQLVEARCGACGESFRRKCSSGQVRGHIAAFAQAHRHLPPLGGIKPDP